MFPTEGVWFQSEACGTRLPGRSHNDANGLAYRQSSQFVLVLSCAAQEHWSCGSADAASAYLQAGGGGIERLLLLVVPEQQAPPGCEPGEVRVARGSLYGTRGAGRSWYQYFRGRLGDKFRVHESALEKGFFLYDFNGRLTFVTVGHVDDLSYAYDTLCKSPRHRWKPVR